MASLRQRRPQGDRLELARLQRVQQARKNFENDRAAVAVAGGVAVMEQQDIPGPQRVRQPVEDRIGIAVDGIEAAARPTRQAQLEPREYWIEERVAQAGRRPKEPRAAARAISSRMPAGPSSEKLCRCRWL
jgi:hypothetical protein